MYKCVIFDIDGTLLKTEKAIISSLQKVLKEEIGKDYEYDDLDFIMGVPGEDTLKRFGINDVQRVMKNWDEYINENHNEMEVYPEIEEVLEILMAKGIKTGIVTSKTKEELKNDFEPFGLSKYLPIVVSADETTKHKPDPEPLVKFTELAGVEPSESLYVGDTIYDLTCATQAGMDFALAIWGTRHADEVHTHIRLKSPREILTLVFREEAF